MAVNDKILEVFNLRLYINDKSNGEEMKNYIKRTLYQMNAKLREEFPDTEPELWVDLDDLEIEEQ